MKNGIAISIILLLLSVAVSRAAVSEVSSVRNPVGLLNVYTAVGCSSLVRADEPLPQVGGVEAIYLPHLSAYRLTPRRPGTFRVGPVTLRVSRELPKPDVGFGFYYSPGRCLYPLEEAYLKDMQAHGMNTLTIQANGLPGQGPATAAQSLARQLNTGVRVGLIDRRFPVICYSADTSIVLDTYQYRERGIKWPELVVQSIDEPNYGQMKDLEDYYRIAHEGGIRIGTACAGYGATGYIHELPWCTPEDAGKPAPGYGHLLDIWVVSVGTLNALVQQKAAEQKAEVWSYLAYDVKNAPLHRWTFGLYAWKCKAKSNLVWAYIDKQAGFDYSRAIETPEGPLSTEGLEGLAEGITDYRVLQAVSQLKNPKAQAWLKGIEDKTTLGWWPRGYVTSEFQDKQTPTVDMAAVRRQGLLWLQGG